MNIQRRVTAKDVARLAGVSQSTVSYVINNATNQSISERTKIKVRQAAEELNYTPSAAARTLRKGTSDTILIILRDAQIGELTAQAIEGIVRTLEPHGYSVVYRRQREGASALELCRELMPAAVASITALTRQEAYDIQRTGVPVVSTEFEDDNGEADNSIILSQTAIGRLHISYLHSKGHQHIAFAAPDIPNVEEYYARRLAGARDECTKLGIDAPPVVDIPFNLEGAISAAQEILALTPRVTAVSAYNDEVAAILLAALLRLDVKVPADIAVIGVDNLPLSPFTYPALTTVNIYAFEVGSGMGSLILRAIRPDLDIPLPAATSSIDLIERDST
ncbi:LacI family DNA-binding transcriptional regulator [Jonesia quinghaiensis]|uniref:LacI family DNA-binding transcriptional regulator n=1 Tax=Jonesia quinghaiensis TaxID=262806 RepID=UPI0009FE2ABA|nr:LacI family DNA-binding transcriptional regulator [Jonesia quinghaiensis]